MGGIFLLPYLRMISYVYYYETGYRMGSAGYIKIERKNDVCRLQIALRHPSLQEGTCHACFYGYENEKKVIFPLDHLPVGHGQIYAKREFKETSLFPEDLSIEKVEGILFVLDSEHYFSSTFQKEDGTEFLELAATIEEPPAVAVPALTKDNVQTTTTLAEEIQTELAQMDTTRADMTPSKESSVKAATITPQAANRHKTTKELLRVYPKLPALSGCHHCIRIEPQDIGILPMEYWYLAKNSFLLHGYYSYHHLLLGLSGENEDEYVLGIPGRYYPKEADLAKMFGFEGFKKISHVTGSESNQNAATGDSGYWCFSFHPSSGDELPSGLLM